jgi:glutamyl-tRNA synthetase
VPLVLGPDGSRLAKRHGAVTLADHPEPPARVRGLLAASLGLAAPGSEPSMADLLGAFDPARLPSEPWTLTPQ